MGFGVEEEGEGIGERGPPGGGLGGGEGGGLGGEGEGEAGVGGDGGGEVEGWHFGGLGRLVGLAIAFVVFLVVSAEVDGK